MEYEMSHGDAVMVLREKTSPAKLKLKALEVIFDGELKYDYNCLNKQDLWDLTRFLYREISKAHIEE